MQKHRVFEGFGEIRASDDLKQRLHAATAARGAHKNERRTFARAVGLLASVAVCAVVAAFFAYRAPDEMLAPPNSEPVSSPPIASSRAPIASSSVPEAQLSDEMFTLLAFSPSSGSTTELALDGVQVILPNMGPDYRTEIVDGKEALVASGWVCPDLSVSGEGIESVTYTAEHELLVYDDPRAFVTEEGLPTWTDYIFLAPFSGFADPAHPTTEEIVSCLEELRKSGDLYVLEQRLSQMKWAEEFYSKNGTAPTGDDYLELYELEKSFVSVPLDYSQFIIETEADEEHSTVLITLINPDNPDPVPVLYEPTVTTRPGEVVAYYYTNETFAKMEVKGAYDLTQIRDTIRVDVLFESGNTKTAYLHVTHDADGVLSMSASEKA